MKFENPPQIRGERLYVVEEEKLRQLEHRLTEAFQCCGHQGVTVCRGQGIGEHRFLTFHCGNDERRMVAFSSLAFLCSTGTEICQMIRTYLTHLGAQSLCAEREGEHALIHESR